MKDRLRYYNLSADILWGAAIASAVTAGVLYWRSKPDGAQPLIQSVDVSADENGAMLRLGAEF